MCSRPAGHGISDFLLCKYNLNSLQEKQKAKISPISQWSLEAEQELPPTTFSANPRNLNCLPSLRHTPQTRNGHLCQVCACARRKCATCVFELSNQKTWADWALIDQVLAFNVTFALSPSCRSRVKELLMIPFRAWFSNTFFPNVNGKWVSKQSIDCNTNTKPE